MAEHISYSRESTYLRCPYAHYLGYIQKLTPKKPARPLKFGTDFHKLLEFRSNKKELSKIIKDVRETYYEMPASWQSELGESYVEDLKTIFKDYMKIYKDSPLPDETEHRFEIPMSKVNGKSMVFVGVIDGLYKHGEDIAIEEHKTFSRKPDMNTLVMNKQVCLYAKAAHKLWGVFPSKVMWDYIKSTPANEPIWLEKSQRFSAAKSDYITPYSYMRAAKARGMDKHEALAQAKLYKGNILNYYFRLTLDLIPAMVEKSWDDFVYVAEEICRNGEKNKVMNMTKDCSWCDFHPICHAQMTGGNVKYTIEQDFVERG